MSNIDYAKNYSLIFIQISVSSSFPPPPVTPFPSLPLPPPLLIGMTLNLCLDFRKETISWSLQVVDILWSDPMAQEGCKANTVRGGGCYFGPNVTERLLQKYNLQFLIRSHECKPEGYEFCHSRKVGGPSAEAHEWSILLLPSLDELRLLLSHNPLCLVFVSHLLKATRSFTVIYPWLSSPL